jgi:hypothetical protein
MLVPCTPLPAPESFMSDPVVQPLDPEPDEQTGPTAY